MSLVRWYAATPADDAGLGFALDHARRLLRPGSRLVVLADPASIAAIPAQRWTGFAAHNEVVVLLLADPLERTPPKAALPFDADGQRVELDLASPMQRQRWRNTFVVPVEEALAQLPVRGVRAQVLSTDDPSDAWLPLLARGRAV